MSSSENDSSIGVARTAHGQRKTSPTHSRNVRRDGFSPIRWLNYPYWNLTLYKNPLSHGHSEATSKLHFALAILHLNLICGDYDDEVGLEKSKWNLFSRSRPSFPFKWSKGLILLQTVSRLDDSGRAPRLSIRSSRVSNFYWWMSISCCGPPQSNAGSSEFATLARCTVTLIRIRTGHCLHIKLVKTYQIWYIKKALYFDL